MQKGIVVYKGYSIGRVAIKQEKCVAKEHVMESVEEEVKRFKNAVSKSKEQLTKIRDNAIIELGEENAKIFDAHLMFLDDTEFLGPIENDMQSKAITAEASVKDNVNNFVSIFESMDDEYMRERAADIKDVGERILKNLAGVSVNVFEKLYDSSIIVAHDLTPSDTASLDKSKAAAFLTDVGGKTSHTAIMAKSLEIPCIVGMGDITSSVNEGDTVIVDSILGEIIINPDDATISLYENKKKEFEKEKEKLKSLINVTTYTKDNKRVEVACNIGTVKDVDKAIENGAEGVGLFRTEFLYMDRDTMPTEEEQFQAYKEVVSKMNPKPVIIRTLDIGGDKQLSYLDIPTEMNPFLGYRAIRLCLDKVDIFKIQLKALLRASVYGNLKVMFPMISGLQEFLKAKEILKECQAELKKAGIPYNENMPVGIMVEIPAAAVCADELAKHVDFFSIGTNDLIQYTLAADRLNEKVSYLYNPMHPAVLKLIKMTIDAAHKEGKMCGMCGEMAGDETAIKTLLSYGLDEFSMSSSSILKAKSIIIEN